MIRTSPGLELGPIRVPSQFGHTLPYGCSAGFDLRGLFSQTGRGRNSRHRASCGGQPIAHSHEAVPTRGSPRWPRARQPDIVINSIVHRNEFFEGTTAPTEVPAGPTKQPVTPAPRLHTKS